MRTAERELPPARDYRRRRMPVPAGFFARSGLSTGFLSKAGVAVLVIGGVMLLQTTGSSLAGTVRSQLRQVLTVDYDFRAAASRISPLLRKVSEPLLGWLLGSGWPPASGRDLAGMGAMEMPVDGTLTSRFGWRTHPVYGEERFHEGVDIEAAAGTGVCAVMDGLVTAAGEEGDLGLSLRLDHGSGVETVYGHLSEVLARPRSKVKKGQLIARVGMTGNARTPHLHFEVVVNGQAVDPLLFLGVEEGSP